jgi:SEC-C motif
LEADLLCQEIGVKVYNWEQDINKVLSKYHLLKYDISNSCLRGEIELLTDDEKYIDIFNVEIFLFKCFPRCFPKVIETEEKIPRRLSRHVMPKSNHLCLAVDVEEKLLCKQGISLLWFLDKVLVPRLCEEFRVNNGEKYQKEYSHDFGATWEFLKTHLELPNMNLVLKFCEALVNKKTPKGNSPCLCGSGLEYRVCHKGQVLSLQHLKHETLKVIYNRLLSNPYKGVNL